MAWEALAFAITVVAVVAMISTGWGPLTPNAGVPTLQGPCIPAPLQGGTGVPWAADAFAATAAALPPGSRGASKPRRHAPEATPRDTIGIAGGVTQSLPLGTAGGTEMARMCGRAKKAPPGRPPQSSWQEESPTRVIACGIGVSHARGGEVMLAVKGRRIRRMAIVETPKLRISRLGELTVRP